jgi:anaerobic selenocysteine-containing dehydrogenase
MPCWQLNEQDIITANLKEEPNMQEWKKTTCVMCAVCCGLEVKIEDNRIVKVRPDKNGPISEGYVCRKGMNIAYHQHNADRLLYPMKRAGDKFERISWDQAIGEIAEKLKKILYFHARHR